jgi:hypothetical protein
MYWEAVINSHEDAYFPLGSIYRTVVGIDGLNGLVRQAKGTPGHLRAQSSPPTRESSPTAIIPCVYFRSIYRMSLKGPNEDRQMTKTASAV